jgi:hypothetical protein
MLDFNDAQPQMAPLGELIPDGTFCKLQMRIRPGGVDGDGAADRGLLKASNTSDVKYLDCEFTVAGGPFTRRKFWQNYTVAGGKLDDKGASMGWNISKSVFRAMIDSALGLKPSDMSPEAKQKRTLQGLSQLDQITFAGRVMIEHAEEGSNYSDSNRLANVVLPGEPQYDAVMRGEAVDPEPINARARKKGGGANAAAAAPAWGQQTGLGATTPAAAPASSGPAWLNQ